MFACLFDKYKIYISPRKLKDDLKMMAYSAPAVHHQDHLVCAAGIAIVGKDGLSLSYDSFTFNEIK